MKSFLIYGCGRSGVAAINLIWNKRDVFYLFDKDRKKQKEMYELFRTKRNIFVLSKLENDLINNLSLIIISPSVSIYNKKILYAKSKGIKVISELELGFLSTKNDFLTITGTNGKTTTTKLLYDMLRCCKKKAELVGNIGIPVCEKVKGKRKTTFVCEVSSFQLEGCFSFKPKICGILNITYDHINRHKTFKRYKEEKLKIAKNMDKKSILVLNNNCEPLKSEMDKFSCQIYFFDINKRCLGAYLKGSDIYFFNGKKDVKIANISSTKLYGKHNFENILCATLIAKLYGVKNRYIQKAIDNFVPYKHRLERIGNYFGVDYIDDSKATNIGATKAAINSITQKTILLLGGSEKGYDFKELFVDFPDCIKRVVVFGETANKIELAAKESGIRNIEKFTNLKFATEYSVLNAKDGEVVLLSPACASFDEFKNYKDRGEKFGEYVKEFIAKKTNQKTTFD